MNAFNFIPLPKLSGIVPVNLFDCKCISRKIRDFPLKIFYYKVCGNEKDQITTNEFWNRAAKTIIT